MFDYLEWAGIDLPTTGYGKHLRRVSLEFYDEDYCETYEDIVFV